MIASLWGGAFHTLEQEIPERVPMIEVRRTPPGSRVEVVERYWDARMPEIEVERSRRNRAYSCVLYYHESLKDEIRPPHDDTEAIFE